MKKIFVPVLLSAIAICLLSCASTSNAYKAERISSNSFSTYKTYAFQPTGDTAFTAVYDKRRLEQLMSAAAIKELSKKKMMLDTLHPDCFFTYTLAVRRNYAVSQQKEFVYNPEVFTPAFDNRVKIYTFSSNNKPVIYGGKINIDTLREGSLVIDMIDTKSGSVVWRSTFEGQTKETYAQPSSYAVNEIIKRMFKKFPAK